MIQPKTRFSSLPHPSWIEPFALLKGASVVRLNRQKKHAADYAREKFNHGMAEWLETEGQEAMKALPS